MLKKCLTLTLILLVCHFSVSLVVADTQAEKDAQRIAKVKSDIARRSVGERERVTIKLRNGSKLKGHIYQVGENDFTIRESESGTTTTVAYSDVAQVKGKGLSTERKILIGLGIWLGIGVILTGARP